MRWRQQYKGSKMGKRVAGRSVRYTNLKFKLLIMGFMRSGFIKRIINAFSLKELVLREHTAALFALVMA